ncbi:hypothetical protein DACRYDRAFT_108557 [Dacryopinax primogenitus]|uniref:HNH nuclease domain-containing protein n=1 Tax=Dacryopinax primogenitus (strain DJM 731) TaxID=1858805 RepID=M5FXH0_DACPD|nr:uncharacterized protein DACRYDRAFT_108557 [Dacryopinax primogenitus]EJU00490.1 hypothetical protein DACRYDRAFT_108557 [Dacryopinax primogenitus]
MSIPGKRFKVCTLSASDPLYCEAQHLIRRHIGNEGIADILLRNLPEPLEFNSPRVNGVDDPRNGVLMRLGLHRRYDVGALAMMVTPYCVLDTNDIVAPASRILKPGTAYPAHARYTGQWFNMATFQEDAVHGIPDNKNPDEVLGLSGSVEPQPSPVSPSPPPSNSSQSDASPTSPNSHVELTSDFTDDASDDGHSPIDPVTPPSAHLVLYHWICAFTIAFSHNPPQLTRCPSKRRPEKDIYKPLPSIQANDEQSEDEFDTPDDDDKSLSPDVYRKNIYPVIVALWAGVKRAERHSATAPWANQVSFP